MRLGEWYLPEQQLTDEPFAWSISYTQLCKQTHRARVFEHCNIHQIVLYARVYPVLLSTIANSVVTAV